MRLDSLNFDFIKNDFLKLGLSTFIESNSFKAKFNFHSHFSFNKSTNYSFNEEDEVLKDTLYFETPSTDIDFDFDNFTPSSHIEYHPEEFEDNDEDWMSIDNQYNFNDTQIIEVYSFENHEDNVCDLLIASDVYVLPIDYSVYLDSYQGFLYLKTYQNQEFILPCVLTKDSKIKYHPKFKENWNQYCDYLESVDKVNKPIFSKKDMYIFTEYGTFKESLTNSANLFFNLSEDLNVMIRLNESINKEKQYFQLIEKLPPLNQSSSKKLKI